MKMTDSEAKDKLVFVWDVAWYRMDDKAQRYLEDVIKHLKEKGD